jgi:hypothetical protein
MKKILLLLFVCISVAGRSQSIVGYWYGSGNVNLASANNYLLELIVKQNTNNSVQAILSYYFKNSYRSVQVNGVYDPKTRQFALFNIAVPYFGSTSKMEVDCQMDFVATHRIAKAGSNLIGAFVGRDAYRHTCPQIAFDLKLNTDAGNQDSVLLALKNFKESYQLWTPSAVDTLVAYNVQQRKIENFVVNNEYKQRQIDVQNEIEIEGDSVAVDFYDNGEVDGDSISVFFNDQLLGANLRLSTKSVHLDVKLDTTKEFNQLAMFANNLGSLPPNTALMIIYDGGKRHEIRLSSSLDKSGAVRIKRKKK